MTLIWFILVALVVILDFATSNILYSWVAVGFLAAVYADNNGVSPAYQVLIACIVGAIFFAIGTVISKKFIAKDIDDTPIGADRLIGTSLISETDIEGDHEVRYRVNGIWWTLKNEGNSILKGEKFIVTRIQNNKLFISKQ